jgi:ABC-type transport system involved in cytochrome c biogenesis permease component
VGTLFAGAVSSSRLLSGLLAIIVFPLALPLVIVSTQLMRKLFANNEPLDAMGLATIAAFDAVFLVLSWIVFEFVLEP